MPKASIKDSIIALLPATGEAIRNELMMGYTPVELALAALLREGKIMRSGKTYHLIPEVKDVTSEDFKAESPSVVRRTWHCSDCGSQDNRRKKSSLCLSCFDRRERIKRLPEHLRTDLENIILREKVEWLEKRVQMLQST